MTEAVTVPILHSERLELRRHAESDLDAAAAMWGDQETVRHIGGRPFTRMEVWNRILRYVGHWSLRPYGYWAVVERTSGTFIGEVGLADWKRDGYGNLLDVPECGWVMAGAARRKGYALEALETVMDWADRKLSSPTVCIIEVDNVASIRLAERVGYRRIEVGFAIAATSLVFERSRSPSRPVERRDDR